jgi:ketosteroid isomerase-like protein
VSDGCRETRSAASTFPCREILRGVSQENVEIARRWTQLANSADVAGVLRLMAPDIQCFPAEDQPESSRGFRGREAFARYIEPWLEAFDDYRIEVSEYIDLGEYVVIVARINARGRESGAETSDDEVWLMRFRDGKAIEYRECRTKEKALEAAGPRQ